MAGEEKGRDRRLVTGHRRRRRFLELSVEVLGPSTSLRGLRRFMGWLGVIGLVHKMPGVPAKTGGGPKLKTVRCGGIG